MHGKEGLDFAPITEVYLSYVRFSSSDTLNKVLDNITRNIDEERGLKSLSFYQHSCQNRFDEWPLSQLVARCANLEVLYFFRFS